MTLVLALGIAVGIVMALTGAGGGILAVPLLVFGAQLGMAGAAPIGLLAVGLAAALGALIGLKAGVVRYRAAFVMALAGMLVAPLGVAAAERVDERWLGAVFAVVLLIVAYRAWPRSGAAPRPAATAAPCLRSEVTGRFAWSWPCFAAMSATGGVAGLMSGMLGVGGGFVVVPSLQRASNLDMQSIVPTSLAVIALVSVSGVAAAAAAGSVDWSRAIPFAAGALGGMLGGRLLAGKISNAILQRGFAVLTAMVALAMLWKAAA